MSSLLRILLCCAVFCAADAGGAKLYKYVKPDGTVAFADKPLADAGEPVAVRQVRVEQRRERFFVDARGGTESKTLRAINEYRGPVEVEISLEQNSNVMTSQLLPGRWVIPGCSERELVVLAAAEQTRPWSCNYKMRYVPGDPAAVHRPTGGYLVPFAAGRSFRITQAFHGKTSHNGPMNSYAVDISMPEGTPIRAARGGLLMDAAFDFYEGGLNRERYGQRANLVRILHDDGTMGVYAHLKLESVRFPLGTRIRDGEVIALSGNTGYTSGPHLHFAILRNSGMRLVSVPFAFADGHGRQVTPEQGMVLTSR